MKVEQIYTGCLAEAAYYIESEGEAVVIDPLRESTPYLERAQRDGATIKYVLETHFHADFVSGHIDLAKKSGATIVYGPTAKPSYDVHIAEDNEVLHVGKVSIVVLHTPGHTMESTTYLLRDESGKDYAIFTGDTLFLGDVGRPDLAVKSDISREDLAGILFDSLRNKLMPLADDVLVYPGHGAGSACGKKMSCDTVGTLGAQKESNYALRANMTKEEFVAEVTEGLTEPPQYFAKNARLNMGGYGSFDEVLEKGVQPLSPDEFVSVVEATDALILDTRHKDTFAECHIPGSVFIGVDESFAPWVGALITDLKQPIVFLCEAGREEEVVTRLARVGYDNTLGYLQGGIDAWKEAGKETDSVDRIDASDVSELLNANKDVGVLDVRRQTEFEEGHLPNAVNFPLDYINANMTKVNPASQYVMHCVSGYRSMIAASILKARGFDAITDIAGGYEQLVKAGVATTTSSMADA